MKTKEEKAAYMRAYHIKNYPFKRAETIERSKAWHKANKERKAANDKKRREAKGAELRAYDKARSVTAERLSAKREWSRKRKMTVAQATPCWVKRSEKRDISFMYHLAVTFTKMFGDKFEVDHIEPLHGKTVSGLHVMRNLQIIPAVQNRLKNNFQLPWKEYP